MGAGPMLPLPQLGLSETQKDQAHDVMQRHRGELDALGGKVQAARQAYQKAVQATPVDENAIRAAAEALAGVMGDLGVARAQVRAEVWALLTPGQQAKAKQIEADRAAKLAQMRQQMQQRRQQGPQGPPRRGARRPPPPQL